MFTAVVWQFWIGRSEGERGGKFKRCFLFSAPWSKVKTKNDSKWAIWKTMKVQLFFRHFHSSTTKLMTKQSKLFVSLNLCFECPRTSKKISSISSINNQLQHREWSLERLIWCLWYSRQLGRAQNSKIREKVYQNVKSKFFEIIWMKQSFRIPTLQGP